MKYFYYFKEMFRSKGHKSSVEVQNPVSKSDNNSAPPTSGGELTKSISSEFIQKDTKLRVFTYSELRIATRNFRRDSEIGGNAFGCVYQGKIKHFDGQTEHTLVVINKFVSQYGFQDHEQWLAEVEFLGVVEHPNLVKLLGYCAEDEERMLVHEYMSNGSLEDNLFRRKLPCLSWKRRMQIILGAAQGLAYLHEELEQQVIYRDFKTSDVLLDKNFQAKLSDFGLSKEGPWSWSSPAGSDETGRVLGPPAHTNPDYMLGVEQLSSKTDVWSFGVVVYEILAGRRSLERGLPGPEQRLLDRVKRYPADSSKKFKNIMDRRLENQYSLPAARKIAKLADDCLRKNQRERPSMSEVVARLKEIIKTHTTDDRSGS